MPQERARVTREKIVLGAAEVIRRVGYANASLGQIAEEAGVTRGALYFHFESKVDIAQALIEEQHRRVRDASVEILSVERPAVTQMMLLCADLSHRLQTDPVVRAGIRLTTDSSTFDEPFTGPYEDWLATFTVLAQNAVARGEISLTVDAAALARFIVAAYTGVQLVSETFTGRKDLTARVHEMWRIVIGAMYAESDREPALRTAEEVFSVSP